MEETYIIIEKIKDFGASHDGEYVSIKGEDFQGKEVKIDFNCAFLQQLLAGLHAAGQRAAQFRSGVEPK